MKKLLVPPLGWFARLGDVLMVPFMYLVAGTLSEAPQRTHRWNNKKLWMSDIIDFEMRSFAHCGASTRVVHGRWKLFLPMFHLPILGGWRDYVVVAPVIHNVPWHIGWFTGDAIGVSRIEVRGPVRMLIGPKAVSFFGVNTQGDQIGVVKIAEGYIGDGGAYKDLPLL